VNVSGHQSLVLAGEYLPAGGVAADAAGTGLALPSGGAILQRVTLVATQPDSTVVLLRADYAAPPAAAQGNTYEALATRTGAATRAVPAPDDAAIDADLPTDHRASRAAGYPTTAALYTQGGRAPQGAVKGGVIDVHA
jgi:hypothetical protein